jgi:probable addiction module antidote protein
MSKDDKKRVSLLLILILPSIFWSLAVKYTEVLHTPKLKVLWGLLKSTPEKLHLLLPAIGGFALAVLLIFLIFQLGESQLIESLKDPEEAAGYLNAALEDGDITVFLLALNNVIQARGGITRLAEKIHKSRTSLHKALSKKGNPYLKNTNEILSAIGMHLSIMPEKADGDIHYTNLQ